MNGGWAILTNADFAETVPGATARYRDGQIGQASSGCLEPRRQFLPLKFLGDEIDEGADFRRH
jgi:hypothetical protein